MSFRRENKNKIDETGRGAREGAQRALTRFCQFWHDSYYVATHGRGSDRHTKQ